MLLCIRCHKKTEHSHNIDSFNTEILYMKLLDCWVSQKQPKQHCFMSVLCSVYFIAENCKCVFICSRSEAAGPSFCWTRVCELLLSPLNYIRAETFIYTVHPLFPRLQASFPGFLILFSESACTVWLHQLTCKVTLLSAGQGSRTPTSTLCSTNSCSDKFEVF